VTIAVLGLGEAGSLLARDLAAGGADVRGYDPRVALVDGVTPRSDEADAVRDADLVLSVNSAHDAFTALGNALGALRPGIVWADLNTASAGSKQRLEAQCAGTGVAFVDVALMSPVPGRGLRTPMLAAGAGAEVFAALLSTYGAEVTVQAGPAGTAAQRKLLRSVFFKGLAAAVVEALAAARAADCEPWLTEHLRAELDAMDAPMLDRLVEGSRRHARRRAEEMDAAAEQVRELGVVPHVATAARDLLRDLQAGS
jgi:3-hydroxyisobutyrate dehydrogenase-like beta-hydroxyacid dehydrogenase